MRAPPFLIAAVSIALGLPAAAQITTTSTGDGRPFDIRSPYLAMTPLIRITGTEGQIGRVGWFGGTFAPVGTLQAHGQTLAIADYPDLFDKIGTTYGGDGDTTFRLPDLRGRAIRGTSDSIALGDTVDTETTKLTLDNLPEHRHGRFVPEDPPFEYEVEYAGAVDPDPINLLAPSLALNYSVATTGVAPTPRGLPGSTEIVPTTDDLRGIVRIDASIDPFGSNNPAANGDLVNVATNDTLFSIFGTSYGGDGENTFALPDLGGRIPVHTGQGPGLSSYRLGRPIGNEGVELRVREMPPHTHDTPDGETLPGSGSGSAFDNREPSLPLNYIIALQGIFPSRSSLGAPGEVLDPFEFGGGSLVEPRVLSGSFSPYIGEIALFAGNFAPRGWAFADGQLLAPSTNDALFSLLGTIYGGDGETTFGLPDLRGRTPIGAGFAAGLSTFRLGQRGGTESSILSVANLPAHSHGLTPFDVPIAPVPLPAAFWGLLAGLGLLWSRGRRASGTPG